MGYPKTVLESEMKKVCFSKQGQKCKRVEKGVPFVVTYHAVRKGTVMHIEKEQINDRLCVSKVS